MARYIDETDVYKLVEPRGVAKVHCSQIDELPRADVAPKNEYEIAIREVGRLSQEVLLNCEITEFEVKEAKAKLSREIFKEIEEILRQHTEGGYYLNGAWFPERLDLYTGDAIAELKKKYMEGENETN